MNEQSSKQKIKGQKRDLVTGIEKRHTKEILYEEKGNYFKITFMAGKEKKVALYIFKNWRHFQ